MSMEKGLANGAPFPLNPLTAKAVTIMSQQYLLLPGAYSTLFTAMALAPFSPNPSFFTTSRRMSSLLSWS